MANKATVTRSNDTSRRTLTSPLKWAGGKRWIVPTLREHFEPYKGSRLVEPFCGGLSVALGLEPKTALLNDINPLLMGFYKNLKRGLDINLRVKNDEGYYYRMRERLNRHLRAKRFDDPEASALFLALNKSCFNGLVRFSVDKETGVMRFNVPFGKYSSINIPSDLSEYKTALRGWSLSCKDFARLSIRSSDILYLDPPYDHQGTGFTEYAGGKFSWEDQVRLAHWAVSHNVPTIISNHNTPRIRELYRDLGFTLSTVKVRRSIGAKSRKSASEIIATSL